MDLRQRRTARDPDHAFVELDARRRVDARGLEQQVRATGRVRLFESAAAAAYEHTEPGLGQHGETRRETCRGARPQRGLELRSLELEGRVLLRRASQRLLEPRSQAGVERHSNGTRS
jgi:hypothetical protein